MTSSGMGGPSGAPVMIPPCSGNKYPPFLDPIKEERKIAKRRAMGSTMKVFAPHKFEDRFEHDQNIFAMTLRDPVAPFASYPRFLICHMCGGR